MLLSPAYGAMRLRLAGPVKAVGERNNSPRTGESQDKNHVGAFRRFLCRGKVTRHFHVLGDEDTLAKPSKL